MERHGPIGWLRAHPRAADATLAVAFFGLGIVGLNLSEQTGPTPRDPDAWAVLLIALSTLPIAARRIRPISAFLVCISALLTFQSMRYVDTPANIATIVALYSVAAHVANRRRAAIVAAFTAIGISAFILVGIARHEEGATAWNLVGNWVIFATAFVLGDNLHRRREQILAAEQRAQSAERSRELEMTNAVNAERTRIAHEMHDIVAHSLSVIVVQATGARRVIEQDPHSARAALEHIERVGRESLTEMRKLLSVLRDPATDATLAPQPTLRSIAELVEAEQAFDVRFDVRFGVEGTPTVTTPSIELTAYRIVQEALTNVRKHAGATVADVTLRWNPDSLDIIVSDNGRGAAANLIACDAIGFGIIGMHERAQLLGGCATAGPRPGGGWTVTATLPLPEASRELDAGSP